MKRGYSREFTPPTDAYGRYLLDKIPAQFWREVRAKAKREGVSLRALILSLLKGWLARVEEHKAKPCPDCWRHHVGDSMGGRWLVLRAEEHKAK